jgi:predicted ATP-grasp superfamily ATP-dependent carboligase
MDRIVPVLIAAYSGRALAASARRGGYVPLVADFFGDDDTLAVAHAHVHLRSGIDQGIDADELEDALATLAAGMSPAGIVCGTGFEDRTGILARLGARWPLIGNSADVIARCKTPQDFASMCGRCGVPHPEIRHAPPDDAAGWLIKRAGGAGGTHIRAAGIEAQTPAGAYYQRQVGGEAVSALVLADGHNAMVLGFSVQWVSPTSNHPFRFGGAAQPAAISAAAAAAMTAAVQRLSAELALVGLNSFDFLLAGDEFHLLEINPRPGATIDIFEPPSGSLFAWHVAACRGKLPHAPPACDEARAAAIVYASDIIRTMPVFDWPAWAADRPAAGTYVSVDTPFCTATASAPTVAEARRLVEARAERIFADARAVLP